MDAQAGVALATPKDRVGVVVAGRSHTNLCGTFFGNKNALVTFFSTFGPRLYTFASTYPCPEQQLCCNDTFSIIISFIFSTSFKDYGGNLCKAMGITNQHAQG